jgi:hypothetical protein
MVLPAPVAVTVPPSAGGAVLPAWKVVRVSLPVKAIVAPALWVRKTPA